MLSCTLHSLLCDVYDCSWRPAVEKGSKTDKASVSAGIVCRVSSMYYTVRKQYEAAYFTVEASLILPAVMLFTVMMIFLGFYSYDRCVMEHSAYEAALRGTSSHYKTAQEAEAAARTAASRLVEDKLFAMHDFQYDVAVDAGSVTVSYRCVVNMPFATWLCEYVPGIDLTLEISRSAKRLRPARTIRDCRVLHGLVAP